jgi:hypothetical protein
LLCIVRISIVHLIVQADEVVYGRNSSGNRVAPPSSLCAIKL